MFGLSVPHLIIILAIVLLIFGPQKLPQTARALGEAINEFKNTMKPKEEPKKKGTVTQRGIQY